MQTKKSESAAGTGENKQLTRGEVLQLLRVCWLRLMENGGKRSADDIESFLHYSMKLALTFDHLEESGEESSVQSIGFHYEEEEESEDGEEDELKGGEN